MAEKTDLDLRLQQRWRLSSGATVRIVEIAGDAVTCAEDVAHHPDRPSPAAPSGMVGIDAFHRDDFIGAELLSPRWRVTLTATPEGENVKDKTYQLLSEVATVEHRSNSVLDSDPEALVHRAYYEAELIAVDAAAAERVVRDTLGERLHSITVDSL